VPNPARKSALTTGSEQAHETERTQRSTDHERASLSSHADSPDRVAQLDTLPADLALARDLPAQPVEPDFRDPRAPLAAVAAAALVAHAHGRATMPQADLVWASDLLLALAASEPMGGLHALATLDPAGAERSAAIGAGTLLLPTLHLLVRDHPYLEQAIARCTTNGSEEIRVAFARAAAPLWRTPCTKQRRRTPCIHRTTWEAIQGGLRDCRLGPYDVRAGRNPIDPLGGPYESTLLTVDIEALMVNRLAAPIVAATAAARSHSCIAPDARRLLDVLLATHSRGRIHWARKGYNETRINHERRHVVRALVEEAIAGNNEPLATHARAFAVDARALSQLLQDTAMVFTAERELRASLLPVWRSIMAATLDAIEPRGLPYERHWSDTAISLLLPTPQLEASDPEFGTKLDRARRDWIDPDVLADLIGRWIPLARHCPDAADALVELARCTSPQWQASTGLVWMQDLIDDAYSSLAGRCWHLTKWLVAVRDSGMLTGANQTRWHHLVDALAAAGDNRAAALQRADE
jgi:hypothetical protein